MVCYNVVPQFVICLFCCLADPEASLTKVSPLKRPRSHSHDREALSTGRGVPPKTTTITTTNSSGGTTHVEVEILLDEDELELGESCGQARMRGRVGMPTLEPAEKGETEGEGSASIGGAQWQDQEEAGLELSGAGASSLLGQSESSASYLGWFSFHEY